MEDDELIQEIAKGDEKALKQLYELYKEKVYTTATYYLKATTDAEELTQDVFVEIFNSASKFEGKSGIATWIYRITVNKCLDKLRYQKRRKRFGFVYSIFNKDTGALMFDQPGNDQPLGKLENKETSVILNQALSKLPPNQQTAFILKQVEGLSQKQIAEIMELGEKAVESLIQRAKANLRKQLENIYKKQRI